MATSKRWKRGLLIAGIVLGGLLSLSPLVGLAGTVIGMTNAFRTLGSSGIADPEALAQNVSVTLYSTAIGLVLCPLGLGLVVACSVLLYRDKPAWKMQPPPLRPPL